MAGNVPATGEELFQERIGASDQYIASPIAAGDEIFATPAIVENKIYLRTVGHLYALGE